MKNNILANVRVKVEKGKDEFKTESENISPNSKRGLKTKAEPKQPEIYIRFEKRIRITDQPVGRAVTRSFLKREV